MEKTVISRLQKICVVFPLMIFLTAPASTNYQLKTYEFGGGGEKDLNSTNYKMEGIVGELNGQSSENGTNLNGGMFYVQMANTPGAPTFTNDTGTQYNKLKIVLNTSNNPSDTTYAIAISKDNWATTQYVQNDNTVGSILGLEDFQTFTAWGGASGSYIIGLDAGTTYKVKVKARQGIFTEGPFGPEATAATVDPSLSFDIDIAASDIETSAPYSLAFGDLTPNAVTTATDKIWIDIETNGVHGAEVFIKGQNAGLAATNGHTINSVTANLTSQTEAWGIRGDTAGQTSGGPLAFQSPYNSSGDNVGLVNTTLQSILSSPSNLTAGRASILLKTKISATTPAADDYSETLTLIAAGIF